MILYLLSLVLAALLGFAAHRASVCTVKAVAELLTTRRAYMLASFMKAVLWVMAVSLAFAWLVPGAHAPPGYRPTLLALMGGFVFGMGAAVNRGCAFSTLTRLGSGDVGMLATLAGFVLGVAAMYLMGAPPPMPDLSLTWSPVAAGGLRAALLAGALWLWAAWELWRLWRSRPRGATLWQLVLARRYRLSTGAALIGISNGVLFVFHGAWAYTGVLGAGAGWLVAADAGPSLLRFGLFAALLAGIVVSARQLGVLRLRRPAPASGVRHLGGGVLMGMGWTLVPGGNFVLLLHDIPVLSPHALPAYVAVLAGIAVPLVAMRAVGGEAMRVDCAGDVCLAD